MTTCPRCDDFGWIPESSHSNWYRADWRIMLDPTVRWIRCPVCTSPEPSLPRVQEYLAKVLLEKVLDEVSIERHSGDWFYGSWNGHAACHYLDKIALVAETIESRERWLLISQAGVMKDLTQSTCIYHLERAGVLPPLF